MAEQAVLFLFFRFCLPPLVFVRMMLRFRRTLRRFFRLRRLGRGRSGRRGRLGRRSGAFLFRLIHGGRYFRRLGRLGSRDRLRSFRRQRSLFLCYRLLCHRGVCLALYCIHLFGRRRRNAAHQRFQRLFQSKSIFHILLRRFGFGGLCPAGLRLRRPRLCLSDTFLLRRGILFPFRLAGRRSGVAHGLTDRFLQPGIQQFFRPVFCGRRCLIGRLDRFRFRLARGHALLPFLPLAHSDTHLSFVFTLSQAQPLWRTASYSRIAAAAEALREEICPRMGIRTS